MRKCGVLLALASSFGGCIQPEVRRAPASTKSALAEFQIAERNAYAAYKETIRPYAQRVVEVLDADMAAYVPSGDNPWISDLRSLRREFESVTKLEFLRTDIVGVYEFLDEANEGGELSLLPDGSFIRRLTRNRELRGTWSVEDNELVLISESGSTTRLTSVPRLWGDWKYFTWVDRERRD